MIYENKFGDRIRFLHIPRTAGRLVSERLYDAGFLRLFDPNSYYNGFELYHLNLNQENAFATNFGIDCSDIPSFTIVRNPIDRFISTYTNFVYLLDCMKTSFNPIEFLKDYSNFYSFMQEEIISSKFSNYGLNLFHKGFRTYPTNWWEKQIEYCEDNIKIWKYENAFGENFNEWIYDNFKIEFSLNTNYKKASYDEKKYSPPKELLDNVEKYYHDDMVKFGYA
jgi:hypothetical protein